MGRNWRPSAPDRGFCSPACARRRDSCPQAAALLDEALPLASADPQLVLDIQIVLQSQLLYRSGKWADAEALLNGAVSRAVAAGDTFRQAMALNNLGMGLVIRNRFDEALSYFERILALKDLDGTSIFGAALNNAGVCYARLGQFERAVTSQQKAIAVHEHGRQRDYAQALGEIGSTYLLQDDVAQAIPYLQRALAIAREAKLATDAALWARNLAAASVVLGKWNDAAKFNQEAAGFAPASGGAAQAFRVVTDAQVAAGRGRADEAERLFQEALAASEGVPAVRWMAYDGLARLAVSGKRTAEAAQHFEAALDTVEKTRSALLRTDYRISFPSRLIPFYRGYVDLLLEQGQVERALEVADSSRGRVLAERQGVAAAPPRTSAAALRQLARQANTVLLFYWLGPQGSTLWLVEGSGIRKVDLPSADRIEALVAEHQAAIQNAMADPLASDGSAGDRLYDTLVAPVAARIPRGASVVVVPDGALHRLNFETLPVRQGAPHYWIEDVTVQVAPSLAMLGRSAGASAPANAGDSSRAPSLLLVGNPTPARPSSAPLRRSERAHPALRSGRSPVRRRARITRAPRAQARSDSRSFTSPRTPWRTSRTAGLGGFSRARAGDKPTRDVSRPLADGDGRRAARGELAYSGEGLVGFAWAFCARAPGVVAGLWTWTIDRRHLMDEVTSARRRARHRWRCAMRSRPHAQGVSAALLLGAVPGVHGCALKDRGWRRGRNTDPPYTPASLGVRSSRGWSLRTGMNSGQLKGRDAEYTS
jgi:tetratricopeptide (TPR) repeat protein